MSATKGNGAGGNGAVAREATELQERIAHDLGWDLGEVPRKPPVELDAQGRVRRSRGTPMALAKVEAKVPKFLAKPWLVESGITILAGHPGGGKSWVAFDLAIALAGGTEYLGTKLEQRGVLYLCVDQTPGEMRGEKGDPLLRGRKLTARKLGTFFSVYDGIENPINLDDAEDQAFLEELLIEGSFTVLFVDSIAPCLGGADMNDEKSTRPIYRFFRKLNNGGITVVLIHHLNKGGETTGIGKMRGSTNIAAEAHVVAGTEMKDGEITCTFWKYRVAQMPGPIKFILEPANGGLALGQIKVEPEVKKHEKQREFLIDLMAKDTERKLTSRQGYAILCKNKLGMNKGAFNALWKEVGGQVDVA